MAVDAGPETTTPGEPSPGQGDGNAAPGVDPRALARDWITIWQTELLALQSNPDMQHLWQTAGAFWAEMAASAIKGAQHLVPRPSPADKAPHDTPHAPGPPPAGPASGAGGDTGDDIHRSLAALERRLADLERRTGGESGADKDPRSAG